MRRRKSAETPMSMIGMRFPETLIRPRSAPKSSARWRARFEDADGPLPGGFIASIEEDIPVRLYTDGLNSAAFLEWAEEHNLPTVVELGGHNFRLVSRKRKALATGVYDPDWETRTDAFKRELKQYAIRGRHRDDYVYGTMDRKKWDKFVAQFNITKENLPELSVLDGPDRTYWQDPSVFGVAEFIAAVKGGEIVTREQQKRKDGALEEVLQAFVDYMPYSLLAMLGLFLGVF